MRSGGLPALRYFRFSSRRGPRLLPEEHMRRTTLAILIAASVGGCEHNHGALMSSPEARPLRLASADKGFRIDAAERARVRPGFDVDALERLLGMVRPDLRNEILANFQEKTARPGHGQGWSALVEINDAKLQEVLEEVWAPMWDNAPDQALEENWYQWPGREIAKRRRAQARSRPE